MIPRILRGLVILASTAIFVAVGLWPMTMLAAPDQAGVLYLPLIIAPVRVSPLQLITSNECGSDFGSPQLSPATFAFGIKQLAVSTTVDGGIGQPWRLEWSVNGERVPDLDSHDVITQSSQLLAMTIVYGANRQCGTALPRGVYQVRLFLNEAFYQEATVTIQ